MGIWGPDFDYLSFGGDYTTGWGWPVPFITAQANQYMWTATPEWTATSDGKAVVNANSKGNGKGPGKGRGKGKGTGKSRGKDNSAAKFPRTLKSNGNCTSTCNSVVTDVPEVDNKNAVVTDVGGWMGTPLLRRTRRLVWRKTSTSTSHIHIRS